MVSREKENLHEVQVFFKYKVTVFVDAFSARGLPAMEWGKRVKIAVGSARGLAYLHEDCALEADMS